MSNKVFPKYHELVCATYPDTGFIASGENCVLQSELLVTRARLEAGGTFFRSVKDGGTGNVNNIILECIVTPRGDGRDDVIFNIIDVDGAPSSPIEFLQSSGSPCLFAGGSPPDGISVLRGILNTGSPNYLYPVIMPEIDNEQPWDALTQDAHCTLSAFASIAMGSPNGTVPAVVLSDGSASIRTGPSFTLFHVQQAETGTKGEITEVDRLSEWDGTQWIAYPSQLYEAGSGSPALCGI